MSVQTIFCKPFDSDNGFEVRIYNKAPKELVLFPNNEQSQSALVVIDQNVVGHYARVCKLIERNFKSLYTYTLKVKEKSLEKSISILNKIIDIKPDIVIAFGGGTLCDLTGFAASIFRRGIPVILFPTTLLSMADITISGKTGIDYANLKNSIGTIHYPLSCISIIEFLETLDQEEFNSAISESIKISVTSSKGFFFYLAECNNIDAHSYELPNIIFETCRLKAELVEGNALLRLYSLYGHVIGQALESIIIPSPRHGDCVSIGLNVEGYFSYRLGLWKVEDWERQENLLKAHKLPVLIPDDIDIEILVEKVLQDRYASENEANFILPQCIGQVSSTNGKPWTPIKINDLRMYLTDFLNMRGT